jgi:hypothetical protein
MGGGTTSSSSENRPLTAAERQDIYRSSLGNIQNTYNQSGLPNDPGSMDQGSTYAAGPWSSAIRVPSVATATPGLYNTTGSAGGDSNTSGMKSLNPFGLADKPNLSMPTGAPDPGGINFPVYQTPIYQTPGAYKGLSDGDYSKLQSDILRGTTSGLDYAKTRDLRDVNENAAKRGVWSSGLAIQSENDIKSGYAPQYEKAGADATSQRYALQTGDNAGENTYNLTAAGAANAANQTNAQNRFSSSWAPLNYLSGIYSGTAGNVGGTNTFGANISI